MEKMFDVVYSALYPSWAHLGEVSKNFVLAYDSKDITDKNSVLVLHGGEDISPSFYGEKPNYFCVAGPFPSERDKLERDMYLRAIELNIPVVGICRGAQLACSLNGGKLAQHVLNHNSGGHPITLKNGETIATNSLHHQMMITDGTDHELLGWCDPPRSTEYLGENERKLSIDSEPEIVWFNQTKTLAIQGHPEWLPFHHPLVQFMLQTLKEKL